MDIFWGSLLNWIIFMGYLFKLSWMFLGYTKISNSFWGMHKIPNIFWGTPSDQIFFWGTELMLRPSLCV